MKIYIIICFFLFVSLTKGTAQEIINLHSKRITQIIFPHSIEKIKGGFDPSLFIIETYKQILYIQPLVSSTLLSNLSVITTNDDIFLLDIQISDATNVHSYSIKKEEAVNYIAAEAAPIPSSSTTIPSVKMENVPSTENKIRNSLHMTQLDEIASLQNTLITNNGVSKNDISMLVTGLYATTSHIYIKFQVTNYSNINIQVSDIHFNVVSKKQKKESIVDDFQVMPIAKQGNHLISGNTEEIIVYQFDLFSFDEKKILLVNMFELGGERNLQYDISHKAFLSAEKIKEKR